MNYELLLKKHELKVTPQRLGILSLMYSAGHIDIETLFENIKKEFTSISLATLYKNINAMLKSTLIAEIKVSHMKTKYEIHKSPHAHLLCQECKEFIDIDIDLKNMMSEASEKSHYELLDSNIVLCGICEKCQNS